MIARYLFLAICVATLSTIVVAQNPNWVSFPQGLEINDAVSFIGEYQGKLLVCGKFTKAGSITANNIALWDGTSWSTLGEGMRTYSRFQSIYPSNISSIVEYKNQLYAIGAFDSAGSVLSKYMARWDGNNWQNMGKQPNDGVNNLIVFQNSLYVIGRFDSIGDMPAKFIARWDGNEWYNIPVSTLEYYNMVNLVVYDNELVLFGSIEKLDNEPIDGIVRWNGSEWLVFPHGLNYEGNIPVVWNNKLIVGYRSKLVNGQPGTVLKHWNDSSWKQFSGSLGGISGGYLYTHNKKLYSCGSSKNLTDTVTNVWEWDTITNTWQGIGSGLNNFTYGLLSYNGELYAGGSFTKANGAKHNYLARYTTTTGLQKEVSSKINISVYPNPSKGSFTLQILPSQQTVTCNIHDITGKVVYTTIQLNNTLGKITIENTGLNSGIYFCQVVLADNTFDIRKVIIAD